jgi:hypothetical protein
MATVLKVLAAVGLVLNAFLLITRIPKMRADEDGAEKWAESKKFIPYNTLVGIAANFLDVFGIGSFATTSAAFKLGKSVRDGDIAGTMIVGDTIPICIEAFLFAKLAGVDGLTLGVLIVAAVAGAFVELLFQVGQVVADLVDGVHELLNGVTGVFHVQRQILQNVGDDLQKLAFLAVLADAHAFTKALQIRNFFGCGHGDTLL